MKDPAQYMIEVAELTARKSPCAKSKRGVVIFKDRYLDGSDVTTVAVGFNGPPHPIVCLENQDCARDCGKRCVHAEMRALRDMPRSGGQFVMLHVKIGDDGLVTGGGGPSCWQCSREILDFKIIHGVWLYQLDDGQPPGGAARWRYWEAAEFHRETCLALGIV